MAIQVTKLPSYMRLLDLLIADLLRGRQALVLVGRGMELSELKKGLRQHPQCSDLDLESIEAGNEEPQAVIERTFLRGRERGQGGIGESQLLPKTLWVSGLDHSTKAFEWVALAQDLATRFSDSHTRLVLPFSAPSLVAEFAQVSQLAIHSALGIPSLLDLRLLCRLGSEGDENSPETRWREYVLPELAGSNPELIHVLWDVCLQGEESLIRALKDYAHKRLQEDAESSVFQSAAGVISGSRVETLSAAPWAAGWAGGTVNYTPENGAEVSLSYLAVNDEISAIRHRVWRGQAALLLPMIDGVRRSLCRHLTRRYGDSWPEHCPSIYRSGDPEDLTPHAMELAPLIATLRDSRSMGRERSWVSLASKARQIRNEIAHYRPVEFSHFHELWRLNEAFAAYLRSEASRREQ